MDPPHLLKTLTVNSSMLSSRIFLRVQEVVTRPIYFGGSDQYILVESTLCLDLSTILWFCMAEIETGLKGYSCPYCGKGFSHRSGLSRHTTKDHLSEKQANYAIGCSHCESKLVIILIQLTSKTMQLTILISTHLACYH